MIDSGYFPQKTVWHVTVEKSKGINDDINRDMVNDIRKTGALSCSDKSKISVANKKRLISSFAPSDELWRNSCLSVLPGAP